MVRDLNTLYEERLKYEQDILQKIKITLPPNNAEAVDSIQVYRAVENAEDIHMNDFIPKAFKNPHNSRIQYTASDCGISIFSDISSIKKMLKAYRGKQREIAIGNLYAKWGKRGQFNEKNHADFWKYISVDYQMLVKSFTKAEKESDTQ